MLPFIVLALLVIGFLLVIKLIAATTGRLSERLLTNYFRSAEALLDSDRLPTAWGDELQKMARRGTVRTGLIQTSPWQEAAKPYLLKNLRALRTFFETCPYVENQEVRELMLQEFDTVTTRWEASDLPEILDYYDVPIDTR